MINIIVAHSLNHVIGKDNKLIWKQSADLKRFKELTSGNVVIMGRKTYESIGRPLPNRRNIVISRANQVIEGLLNLTQTLAETPTGTPDASVKTTNSFQDEPKKKSLDILTK